MIQEDWQSRLCLMLAFQTVVAHGKQSRGMAEKVIELARRMNEFCVSNLSKAFHSDEFSFIEDYGAARIDVAIDLYKQELRTKEQTQLPQDRENLIHLYDRLQQRKARRMQRQFFTMAKEDKLADLVLNLLDEELEETSEETR
ncbi:MAG: hypothetical protein PHD48_11065 [Alphaproteobacteria bacterium]|nr:hypothetical protein [Alphaproteobacteria bacterium]